MRKHKEVNLRKTCLKRNFIEHVISDRCANQDNVKEADIDAPSNCMKNFPQSVINLGDKMPATQDAEQKIVGELPLKRPLEGGSQALLPSKKKRKTLNPSPQPCQLVSADLAALPQVRIPASRKCKPVPVNLLPLYVEAEHILDNAEKDMESFFEDDFDEEDGEKCCNKDLTSVAPSAVDEDLVFKEITSFQQRHEYKKFYNRNLLLGQQLKEGIELSNEYMSTLRQAIKLLPVYSDHYTKLISKFNKVLLSYKVNPVHGEFKTVCRNLVLVKMLITKFNNKHGLSSNSVTNIKKKIAC